MARRRLVWHLGLPQAARPVVPATLEHHAEALGAAGVRVVASREEAERALQKVDERNEAADEQDRWPDD